ncbi:Gly-X carboxypeptidase [Mycena chlorophos]|uniref:Gly-X carboxypeptidase n=1 Tax=Mycena chlorophos TaxID=658473 RepID=A0A8H6T076_MYCCL|nr:Gly-X carboxypeptidase [Mycena chlorophos]
MTSEKASTVLVAPPPPRRSKSSNIRKIWAFSTLGLVALALVHHCGQRSVKKLEGHSCAQVETLFPDRHATLFSTVGNVLATEDYKMQAVRRLSGAIQIPTEVFDDMLDVADDPRWEVFAPFHDYLSESFPLVYSTLSLTKPILLAAHQDVVPVEPRTYSNWTHPPFSGYFDGKYIWGRGSADDKDGLIAIMSAVETLISNGFKPTRTVVLAFGFDEEATGRQGARALSVAMHEIYGSDHPFAFIVDEGEGIFKLHGTVFATPDVTEKGYLDVAVEVTSPGGHSSVPPEHTTIGILAKLLVAFEQNPPEVRLTRESIIYEFLQCTGEHGAAMPEKLRRVIQRSAHSDRALRQLQEILSEDPLSRALCGVKSNALPETAFALVNHRISTDSSVGATMAHDTALLKELAEQFNLSYTAFGKTISGAGAPAFGTLVLSDAYASALEPAPISPIRGPGSEAYQLLSGTIKATYASHRSLENGDEIVVAPALGTGNTDTQRYWNLSRSIFRYNHGNWIEKIPTGAHTVDEATSIDTQLETIRFFVTLILNSDESSAL